MIKLFSLLFGISLIFVSATGAADTPPLLWYKLDETSGALIDASGNGANGTTYNGVVYGASGVHYTALRFDGDNDYADAPDQARLRPTKLTIMAWIKADNTVNKQWFLNTGRDYYGSGWGLSLNNNKLVFTVNLDNIDNGNEIVVSTPYNDTTQWHHVAATYDGTTARLYLDGVECATVLRTGSIIYRSGQGTRLTLGRLAMGDWFKYKGSLDEVKIYESALTTDQIRAEYAQSSSGVVKIRRVDADPTAASAPVTSAWLDDGVSNTANPARFDNISSGSHTAYASAVPGYTVSAGLCTRPLNQVADCSVTAFPLVPSCTLENCSVKISVVAGELTKVVFQYAAIVLSNEYRVGVNYHAFTSSFSEDVFIGRYHDPAVRNEVRAQLRGMAAAGADVINSMFWLSPTSGLTPLIHFPPNQQDLENIRLYTLDVAEVQREFSGRPELRLKLGWVNCAKYRMVNADGTVGKCSLSWDEFLWRARESIRSIAAAIGDVRQPGGQPVVSQFILRGESDVSGLFADDSRFLKDIYSFFREEMRKVGIAPVDYYIVTAWDDDAVFNDAYTNAQFPILNGHPSAAATFITVKFMESLGIPVPDPIGISFYPNPSLRSMAAYIDRVLSDFRAVFPGKRIAIEETRYLVDVDKRKELGNAFKDQYLRFGSPVEVVFWTTPNGGGAEQHVGYPFDFASYDPVGVGTVKIMRVGADLTKLTAPPSDGWLDGGAPVAGNPATFDGVSAGGHSVFVSAVHGFDVRAGICTKTTTTDDCPITAFPIVPQCDGARCGISGVNVVGAGLTKIVFRYEQQL